eukprot:7683102-Alexandrium_andersonii.AAC.1
MGRGSAPRIQVAPVVPKVPVCRVHSSDQASRWSAVANRLREYKLLSIRAKGRQQREREH